jgi:tetratricopeptide (TPR) repeat protein
LSFFLLSNAAFAQSAKAYEKAGDKAFAAKDYYAAFVHFRDAMNLKPEDAGLWFKYAEVTRQFNAYEEAEEYYTKVWRSQESAAFPLATFWLGQVKKSLGKYDEAIEVFGEFLKNTGGDNYFANWATEELKSCRWAVNLEPPQDQLIRIEHLDKKINTAYSEFGAVTRGDELFYSSFRFDFPEDNHLPERKLTKILYSINQAKGRTMPRGFNEDKKHTAHTAFSMDYERVYFTLCEYVTASDIRCEIYYRDKDKRGRWEKKAVKLPEIVNKKGYTTTHPAIGFDSVAQKEVLFFASDRNSGKGKLDIWYCELDKNKFLEPKNLEAVNTPENDISPFFHTASQTLYFSSDGRQPSLGGYDVFAVKRDQDWAEIGNAGKPVNTSYHDLYYFLEETGNYAYLSSNRPGSFYLDASNKACCYDIYQVIYNEIPADTSGIEIPPIVNEEPEKPFIPTTLEDFLPLALYFDNDEPDKRTTRTTTKKSYETTYFKYYDRKSDYIEQYSKPLQEEAADEAALEIGDFFENEVKKGYDFLQLFSEILLKRLENGERVEIVIKGYTSPRAKSDYNDRLAQRRISSLRNHFDTYRGGIFESYLKHGKLVISEAPFGETQASGAVSDDLTDERNSIYSVGAARKRRVEIVEVK